MRRPRVLVYCPRRVCEDAQQSRARPLSAHRPAAPRGQHSPRIPTWAARRATRQRDASAAGTPSSRAWPASAVLWWHHPARAVVAPPRLRSSCPRFSALPQAADSRTNIGVRAATRNRRLPAKPCADREGRKPRNPSIRGSQINGREAAKFGRPIASWCGVQRYRMLRERYEISISNRIRVTAPYPRLSASLDLESPCSTGFSRLPRTWLFAPAWVLTPDLCDCRVTGVAGVTFVNIPYKSCP